MGNKKPCIDLPYECGILINVIWIILLHLSEKAATKLIWITFLYIITCTRSDLNLVGKFIFSERIVILTVKLSMGMHEY